MSAIKGMIIAIPLCLSLEVAAGYGVSAAFSAPEPGVRWEATTVTGELYIIGEGDDCNAAWVNHGPIPDDWRSLECRPIPAQQ